MDESDALAVVEEDVALLLRNGTLSASNETSLWESLASNDGSSSSSSSSSSSEETLLGLRFASSGEEVRFVILISVYALGACTPLPACWLARDSTAASLIHRVSAACRNSTSRIVCCFARSLPPTGDNCAGDAPI